MKKKSTPQTIALAEALEKRGVEFELEHWDGHKHVDMYIPKAQIYIGPIDATNRQCLGVATRQCLCHSAFW